MSIITNRIPDLTKALEEEFSEESLDRREADVLKKVSPELLVRMRRKAPVGEVEPDIQVERSSGVGYTIKRGRPSHRMRGEKGDLDSGWQEPEVTKGKRGTKVTFSSTAEHIEHVAQGTQKKNYPIPRGGGYVAFHWGNPLRWQPVNYPDGPQIFPGIIHPGNQGNPFIEESVQEWLPIIEQEIEATGLEISERIRRKMRG